MKEFVLPTQIQVLITEGLWPSQHLAFDTLFPKDVVQAFAPDEDTLCLYTPPFKTLTSEIQHNPFWKEEDTSLHEIDPDLSLIIGDFGLGSDTVLILDYRNSSPRLMRLQWCPEEMKQRRLKGHWVDFNMSFDELALQIRKNKA